MKDNLVKIKHTKPQMELSKEEREQNVKGVFAVQNAAELKGEKIFLVDDVYTTGATMNSCATALKDGGCPSVFGISIAREA